MSSVIDRARRRAFGQKRTDTGTKRRAPIAVRRCGLLRHATVIATLWSAAAGAQTFRPIDYSGDELFARYCAACHGTAARGDGPVAASLRKHVPDLTRITARWGKPFPAEPIREIIDGRSAVLSHGTRVMPVWGREFWVDEGADIEAERNAREIVERLVRYLESIQQP